MSFIIIGSKLVVILEEVAFVDGVFGAQNYRRGMWLGFRSLFGWLHFVLRSRLFLVVGMLQNMHWEGLSLRSFALTNKIKNYPYCFFLSCLITYDKIFDANIPKRKTTSFQHWNNVVKRQNVQLTLKQRLKDVMCYCTIT